MVFKKFVEVGRVAYVIKGPEKGKLVAFVDVIDYNRVLVDGPCTDVPRQEYRLINLLLTKYKINIQHGQHTKFVRKAWEEAKINERWAKSEWAKYVQLKERKENLSDLERFKVVYLKRAENRAIKLVSKMSLNRQSRINRRKALKVEGEKSKKMRTISKKKPLPQKVCKLYGRLRTKGVLKKPRKPKAEKEEKKRRPRPDSKKGKSKAEKYQELKKKKALARKAKKEGGVVPKSTKPKTETKSKVAKSEKPAAAAKKPAPAKKAAAPKKAPAASKKPAAPKPKKAEAKAK